MVATVYSDYINFREYNRKFENPIFGRIFYFFIYDQYTNRNKNRKCQIMAIWSFTAPYAWDVE